MCWCNPTLRTPCCGKPECHTPQYFEIKYKELQKEYQSRYNSRQDG